GKDTKTSFKHRDTAGQVTLRIFDMKKPVIAAINGHAVGVGITMTLAMDIRFVAEEATKIGFIFNRRGLVPEGCSTYFLPKIVGITRAAELILTGRMFTAEEGMEMGLFSGVVSLADLMPLARKTAGDIAENTSSISTALSRQMLWRGLGEDHPMAAHIIESNCLDFMFKSRDFMEGAASFLEKRPPKFQMKPGVDMPDFFPWWKERRYMAGS
ncbi:MAG: enoyl-CoA hydratase-related protein, partial [Desulfobacterales bacterium]